jgi:2-polyprenyl-3-methyl-5-hydroxy-6-metoxy-1,4-benzoquinol methylase
MPHRLEPLDARIPRWEKASFVDRLCPFCASEGTEHCIRPDQLHIRQCSTCGCYFVAPSPTGGQLDNFYSSYYAHHRTIEFQQYLDDPILVKEMFALDPLSDFKVKTLASLADLKGKRVLDVGFGMGQNLLLMKKLGAEVTGIDLDPDAVQFAREVLGIQSVHRRDIDYHSEQTPYDLITLHDVVEHPLDPLAVLRKARSLLAPNGLLSIWTPNASSVDKEEQPIAFRVDLEHMQYLTFQTCRHIANVLKMTIVHLDAHGFPRLESIRNLSGIKVSRRPKQVLRSLLKSFPGFVQLNALRKRFGMRDSQSGSYHLFCVMKNNAGAL